MTYHWPTFVSAFLTALACTLISLADTPKFVAAPEPRFTAPQQSQIQFIVVPTAPTDAELKDKRIREMLAQRNKLPEQ